MAESLRDRGARIGYVVPPVYKPLYELNRAGYKTYLQTMRRILPPGPVLDFNDPEYSRLTSARDMFFGCFHVRPKGAAAFSALLAALMPNAIVSGQ